jgi:hypothetical protein
MREKQVTQNRRAYHQRVTCLQLLLSLRHPAVFS